MVKTNSYFERFKEICTTILAQSGNCVESQADMANADSVPKLVAVWLKYWHGLITEVPQQTIAALYEVYEDYKSDINVAGVFFNESRDSGIVLVGNHEGVLKIGGNAKAYVLGKAEVSAYDHAYIYADNKDAKVLLNGHSRGNIHKSKVHACDWATLFTDSKCVYCADASRITITNGKVYDSGHISIDAFNGSTVYSLLRKGITLDKTSKIVKKHF